MNKIDWSVLLARAILVAGLFSASGTLTPFIPEKYRAWVVGASAVILAISKSVQTPSGIVRPANIDTTKGI